MPRAYGGDTGTVRDPAVLLPALARKPRAWGESPIRADFPDRLRLSIDAMESRERQRTLRLIHRASESAGFDAAARAAEHLVEQGHGIDEASLMTLARRIAAGETPHDEPAPDPRRLRSVHAAVRRPEGGMMTKPGTAQPDTRRRRASTGQLMDGIMGLARRLPLTRQVLADQLETATPAQTGVHARVDERRDRFPGAFQTRATARTGRVPPNQDARRLRPGRPCASPSTTGGRHWNPSTSSSTRRTWPCSALPAPARPTWPSRWPGRPAWRAYRPGSSPPPSSSCDYCAPTRRTGSTGSPPRIGRARLLVVDELGYIPIDEEGSRLLFQVVTNAYERQSIVHDRQHRVRRMGQDLRRPQHGTPLVNRPYRPPRQDDRIRGRQLPQNPRPHAITQKPPTGQAQPRQTGNITTGNPVNFPTVRPGW